MGERNGEAANYQVTCMGGGSGGWVVHTVICDTVICDKRIAKQWLRPYLMFPPSTIEGTASLCGQCLCRPFRVHIAGQHALLYLGLR